MKVLVRLFATAKEAAGVDNCSLFLPSGSRGIEAKAALAVRFPKLQGLLGSARMGLNWEYRPWKSTLQEGDELSIIPPVSGG